MMELLDLSLVGETRLVVIMKLQETDKHFVELMVVEELLKADTVCNEKQLFSKALQQPFISATFDYMLHNTPIVSQGLFSSLPGVLTPNESESIENFKGF
ncbi:hypothetical protein Tco_1328319 [Tanacetum coccineum]